jgi:hypothetical protein
MKKKHFDDNEHNIAGNRRISKNNILPTRRI